MNRKLASLISLKFLASFMRLFLFLLCLLSFNVFAETNAKHTTSGKVTIGAYINGVRSIDIKAGTVDLDLYVWFRTKGEKNPLDSFEIMNGSISEKSSIVKKKIGDENYYSMRIAVKAFQSYDLRKFPLDNQNLTLFFEDSEDDSAALQFVPDEQNTKVGKSVTLPGWKVGNAKITVHSNTYDTNYGDLSIGENGSKFSRTIISIPIDREGIGYFFKLFGTVLLAASVAFLSFFIKPVNLDPRFGLGVGGIFAVVASNLVLSSMLPETPQVTLAEGLLLLTIVAIFISLLESVVSLTLWESDKQPLAIKLDYVTGWLMPTIYLLACALMIAAYQY